MYIKDMQFVCHVYGGRSRCHGNCVLAVNVVNIVLHINDINKSQNPSMQYSVVNVSTEQG